MPLSKKGKKLKSIFKKEYGKKKGERIFYAYERKHKDLKIPSPKEAIKMGISIGALGLGVGLLNKYSGGN